MQVGERQGGEETGFFTSRYHRWGGRHAGCDPCGELVGGNANPHRQVEGVGGDNGGLAYLVLARRTFVEALHITDVGEREVWIGIFHPRRKM
jgi:hypothetical protein